MKKVPKKYIVEIKASAIVEIEADDEEEAEEIATDQFHRIYSIDDVIISEDWSKP